MSQPERASLQKIRLQLSGLVSRRMDVLSPEDCKMCDVPVASNRLVAPSLYFCFNACYKSSASSKIKVVPGTLKKHVNGVITKHERNRIPVEPLLVLNCGFDSERMFEATEYANPARYQLGPARTEF